MPEFSESTIRLRFRYFAKGRCECEDCRLHIGRCDAPFAYEARGEWRAVREDPGGSDELGNCRIVCARCCEETER